MNELLKCSECINKIVIRKRLKLYNKCYKTRLFFCQPSIALQVLIKPKAMILSLSLHIMYIKQSTESRHVEDDQYSDCYVLEYYRSASPCFKSLDLNP